MDKEEFPEIGEVIPKKQKAAKTEIKASNPPKFSSSTGGVNRFNALTVTPGEKQEPEKEKREYRDDKFRNDKPRDDKPREDKYRDDKFDRADKNREDKPRDDKFERSDKNKDGNRDDKYKERPRKERDEEDQFFGNFRSQNKDIKPKEAEPVKTSGKN